MGTKGKVRFKRCLETSLSLYYLRTTWLAWTVSHPGDEKRRSRSHTDPRVIIWAGRWHACGHVIALASLLGSVQARRAGAGCLVSGCALLTRRLLQMRSRLSLSLSSSIDPPLDTPAFITCPHAADYILHQLPELALHLF